MDLTWSQNLVYGMISGLTEILPVSAQAHRLMLRKVFGTQYVPGITLLLIHFGILTALFFCCQNQILRIHRARRLARIPKKKRRRPLDMVSLMDFSLLRSMFLPVLLAFVLGHGIRKYENNIFLVSGFLFLNGILLYIPQYLPGSNKDARSLTRVQGLLIGLGTALSALPGISAMGMALSFGQVFGEDRKYRLNMALLLEIGILIILIFVDIFSMAADQAFHISFGLLMMSVLAGIGAFLSAVLGVKLMRKLAEGNGFSFFSYYCWAMALFSIILTLFA